VNASQFDQAITSYRAAIDSAGSLRDLRQLALTYSGLALAYHETGQVEAAARYGMRSVALLEVQRDRVALARAENNLGLILLAKGDNAGAREHLDRSLELCEETDLQVGRGQILLSLCELSLQEYNLQQARAFATEALQLAKGGGDDATAADAHVWLAQVADRCGDHDRADQEFHIALAELSNLGNEERLLRCHGIYAEVLERRGEMEQAYVHMKKAFSASRPGLLHRDDEVSEQSATPA
jgi:tetratricopeptide (TPR) repeat protein